MCVEPAAGVPVLRAALGAARSRDSQARSIVVGGCLRAIHAAMEAFIGTAVQAHMAHVATVFGMPPMMMYHTVPGVPVAYPSPQLDDVTPSPQHVTPQPPTSRRGEPPTSSAARQIVDQLPDASRCDSNSTASSGSVERAAVERIQERMNSLGERASVRAIRECNACHGPDAPLSALARVLTNYET
jgi:hypothetical protein